MGWSYLENRRMPTRNVNLTEHFDRFIDAGITSGRFSDASEVVREGLRLLEQREQEDKAKLEWLRGAVKEGFDDIERGDYVTLRSNREIGDLCASFGKKRHLSRRPKIRVANRPKYEVHITRAARRDMIAVMKWTLKEFGERQFMRHSGYELSRGSFWWRVKRLANNGSVTRHLLPMVHYDPILAIASSGFVYLVENLGSPYSGPEAGPEVRRDGLGVAHALGVNAVHLDLLRSRALVSWENEMEIRCRNEMTAGKYAKDYDAIITLALGDRQLRFALEYERTPKTQSEYGRIVSLLESERNLDRVLYLAGTRQIHSLLKQRLWRIRQRVLLGLASDLPKTEPADLEVVDAQHMS
jgi:antitoxin ParD1/3/4